MLLQLIEEETDKIDNLGFVGNVYHQTFEIGDTNAAEFLTSIEISHEELLRLTEATRRVAVIKEERGMRCEELGMFQARQQRARDRIVERARQLASQSHADFVNPLHLCAAAFLHSVDQSPKSSVIWEYIQEKRACVCSALNLPDEMANEI